MMKKLLILIVAVAISFPAIAQVKKQYTEVPNRAYRLTSAIGVGELVLQQDSVRWVKVTHIIQPGWKFDTVYKRGWYKLQPAPVETDPVWLSEKSGYLTSATAASTFEPLANKYNATSNSTTLYPTWRAIKAYADSVAALKQAAGSYEPAISSGTTAQYWRGDKTWQTLPSGSQWSTNGSSIYYLGGNVGIGVSNPSATLRVSGNVSITQYSGFASAVDATATNGIGLSGTSTNAAGVFGSSSNSYAINGQATNSDGGHFYSLYGNGLYATSVNAYAAIFDAGNVGIGTTAPTAKLQVNGLTKTNTLQVGGYNVSVTGDCSIPQAGGSYSAGYGLSLSSTTFSADTSKLVTFGDTAATGGKIATKYGLAAALAGYMSNPMTTNGDLIYQHNGVPTRIPVGTYRQCLRVGPDDGNGLTLEWIDQEWATNSTNAYRSTGNVGIGTSTPMHKASIVGSKATNLNMLNLVSSDWNKSRTSVATATDTSSASLTFTDGGKPIVSLKNNTGGTVMSIDSVGRVGLGTAAQTALLELQGNKSTSNLFYISNDRNSTKDTAIVFTSGGNLGINTIAPSAPLHSVSRGAGVIARFQRSNLNYLDIENGSDQLYIKTNSGYLRFVVNSAGAANEMITMNSSGIGIGTGYVSQYLSMNGNAARTFNVERNTTTNTAGNSLTLQAGGATSGATDKLGGPLYFYPGQSTGNAIGIAHQWWTYNATTSGTTDQTATAKMTMTSAGKIGIGTTAPSSTLHVVGAARVSDSLKALGKVYATNITRQDTGTYKLLWNSGTGEIKAAVNEPDHVYAYYSGAGITRASAVSNTYYPIVGALTSPEQHNFSVDGDSCLIYYTGATGHVKHYISITFAGTSNEDIEFDLYNINDAAEVPTSQLCTATGTGDRQNITLVCYDVNATKNDRYELRLRNTTATNNVIVYRIMWWGEATHN